MKKEKDLLSRGVVEDFRQVYEDGHFPEEVPFEEFFDYLPPIITSLFKRGRSHPREIVVPPHRPESYTAVTRTA